MYQAHPFNLGYCILPSKVASDTSFLSRLWTDLARMLTDFRPRVTSNVPRISAILVLLQLRKGASGATFEGKIQQPKLKERGLLMDRVFESRKG